jgi:hypothetical protein
MPSLNVSFGVLAFFKSRALRNKNPENSAEKNESNISGNAFLNLLQGDQGPML